MPKNKSYVFDNYETIETFARKNIDREWLRYKKELVKAEKDKKQAEKEGNTAAMEEYNKKIKAYKSVLNNEFSEAKKTQNNSLFSLMAYIRLQYEISTKREGVATPAECRALRGYLVEAQETEGFHHKGIIVNPALAPANQYIKDLLEKDQEKLDMKLYGKTKPAPEDKVILTEKTSLDDLFSYDSKPVVRGMSNLGWENMRDNVSTLYGRLLKADKNMHVNSVEFNVMKNTMKKMHNFCTENQGKPLSPDKVMEAGEIIESLQTAAQFYIDMKGLDPRKTEMGKARMQLAADINRFAFQFRDNFPMKERAEITKETYEQDYLNDSFDDFEDDMEDGFSM